MLACRTSAWPVHCSNRVRPAINTKSPIPAPSQVCTAGLTRVDGALRLCVFMPVAKLSPINQATISITPWMPKVIMPDSSASPVKLRMPSQVVYPDASDSTTPVVPRSASCQLENMVSSSVVHSRLATLDLSTAARAAKTQTSQSMGRAFCPMPSISPSIMSLISIAPGPYPFSVPNHVLSSIF